jgi:hypothetical protein
MVTQVRNYWFNQAWEKYKAVRERQEHTGGDGGDADRDNNLDLDNSDKDADGDIAVNRSKPKRNQKPKFSERVLDTFEQSKNFVLIDAVYVTQYSYTKYTNPISRARDDESVVHLCDFNSSADILDFEDDFTPKQKCVDSDDEKPSEVSKMLTRALDGMEAKRRQQEELDRVTLDLAMKHDQWEQEEHEERHAKAHRKETQDRRNAGAREWAQAMQMLDHTNPLVQQRGEQLVAKLTEEEEGE